MRSGPPAIPRPPDRLGAALGAWSRPDVAPALVRDGGADAGEGRRRVGGNPPSDDRDGGGADSSRRGAGHRQRRGRRAGAAGGERAANGHCEVTCAHPLLFDREGDCLAARLRSGNVHRIPSHGALDQAGAELRRRPVGRPSYRLLIRYLAGSWTIARCWVSS